VRGFETGFTTPCLPEQPPRRAPASRAARTAPVRSLLFKTPL